MSVSIGQTLRKPLLESVDQETRGKLVQVMASNLVEVKRLIAECESTQAKVWLLHEQGTLSGLLGYKSEQESSWLEAHRLDPKNQMVRQSLHEFDLL